MEEDGWERSLGYPSLLYPLGGWGQLWAAYQVYAKGETKRMDGAGLTVTMAISSTFLMHFV